MEKKIVPIVIGLLLFALGWRLGTVLEHAKFPDITERTDTLVVRDSLPFYYPVPKDSAVIRYVDVPVTVTVSDTNVSKSNVNDENTNVNANVNVPIERKVYEEDSTYYAVVTGPAVGDLHPSLDTLKVYRETVTIETTKKVTEYKPYKWSVSPFVSQEVGLSHYDAKVGVQAEFGRNRWRFIPEIGYRASSLDEHGWYAGGRLKFDLIRGK